MIYRFKVDGKVRKFNTDKATLLMSSDPWRSRDWQYRWDLYRTRLGTYVFCFLWQCERGSAVVVDKAEALAMLAIAEPGQLAPDGERLLEEYEPSEEI